MRGRSGPRQTLGYPRLTNFDNSKAQVQTLRAHESLTHCSPETQNTSFKQQRIVTENYNRSLGYPELLVTLCLRVSSMLNVKDLLDKILIYVIVLDKK